MDPCDFTSDVYQSPIALTNRIPSVFHSESNLHHIKENIISHYDPNLKQWNVLNQINTSNNELHYKLSEFHLHQPGEHVINDKHYPLEIHFVFEDLDDFSILVIGYVFKLASKSSKLISRIIKDKPFSFPKLSSYYSYPGSLTTQPFDFNVSWIVMSQPLSVTEKDLEILATRSKNARRIHPRNGRDIVYATECC